MQFKSVILLTSLVIMASSFTCNNSTDTKVCGIKDPVNNIGWLKERVENADEIEIFTYKYNDLDYISVNPCPGCPDSMLEIFDCQGNVFCTIGGITGKNTCPADFLEKSEKLLLLKK